ncbi:hypothetical protein G3I17_18290 [Streptomyces sp. SID13031]|nr:condensation domain-containing protein [Streptomyces sp. SID13031]NEA33601.1 hypothetical protein [Streptomyces sp. SID13031]
MSREQETVWLDDLIFDGASRYLEAWASRLTGRLDIGALEWAISQVIARHEVLRSRLTESDGEPVQIVTAAGRVQLAQLSCSPAALPAELSRIVAEPLDLNEAPIRPWLLSLTPDEFVLVVQFHHAAFDDWSLNILQRELMHFYSARVQDRPAELEPLRMQAGEFAVAQRAAGLDPQDLEYWRERVKAAPRSCTIPPDRPGSEELPHRAEFHLLEVSPELGQAVRAAGRALRATPFTLFAGAMAALLWQYGEQQEVIFGTPVSLRGTAADDGMIGFLTNLHPIRLAVSRDMTFRMLVNAAKAEVLSALEHRAVPYSTIVAMSRRGLDPGAPLCDVSLVLDDMRWEPFSLPELTAETIRVPEQYAKYALHLILTPSSDGGYTGAWNYDAEVYSAATMARAAGQFAQLLAHCVAAPDKPLGEIAGSAA